MPFGAIHGILVKGSSSQNFFDLWTEYCWLCIIMQLSCATLLYIEYCVCFITELGIIICESSWAVLFGLCIVHCVCMYYCAAELCCVLCTYYNAAKPSCAGFKFPFHYRRILHSSLGPLASFDDHNEVHHIRICICDRICVCDCLCVCIFESVFVPAGERHSLAAGDRGASVSDLHRLQNCQIRARIFSNI